MATPKAKTPAAPGEPTASSLPSSSKVLGLVAADAGGMLACEMCRRRFFGENIPFPDCWYCGAHPSGHHGRCCAWKPKGSKDSDGEDTVRGKGKGKSKDKTRARGKRERDSDGPLAGGACQPCPLWTGFPVRRPCGSACEHHLTNGPHRGYCTHLVLTPEGSDSNDERVGCAPPRARGHGGSASFIAGSPAALCGAPDKEAPEEEYPLTDD